MHEYWGHQGQQAGENHDEWMVIMMNIWWWKRGNDNIMISYIYSMIWYRDNFYLGEGIENGKGDRGSKKKVGHGQGENENVPETISLTTSSLIF